MIKLFKKLIKDIPGRIFLLLALSSLSILAIITIFIVAQSVPFFKEIGFFKFIFGMEWSPGHGEYGVFPMIVGSLSVTLGAILIGVPIGLCCAIFLAEFAPAKLRNIFRPAIQLLAGIPSVVYGFVGLMFVVPFIMNFIGGPGASLLAGSVILAVMILPTVISISEVALMSLPRQYKEGALALGMTHWQTIWRVQLPAAKSGIVASAILGMGRAIGETMAAILVLGNAPAFPRSILDPLRTLTTNIGIEMGYATGTHKEALFATGVVLFVIIMLISSAAQYFTREKLKGKSKSKTKKAAVVKEETAEKPEEKAVSAIKPRVRKSAKENVEVSPLRVCDTSVEMTAEHESEPTPKKRLISPRASAKIAKAVIWFAAMLVISVLVAIIVYLLVMGLPTINWTFLTDVPRKMGQQGGVSSAIMGTFLVTFWALLFAVPFGVGTAFFLAEYTKENLFTRIIRFCVESLAGIPSIVYGLFGFIFFVIYLNMGWSVLAGGLTLAVMILPTIIRTSEEAIKTVTNAYRETSFSLGATKWQTIRKAVFPSALRGIVNGIILAVGRCVAETAALTLTAGTAAGMPESIFDSTRTLASHFYILTVDGLVAMDNAYGTAALLIILILIINVGANALVNRFVAKGK